MDDQIDQEPDEHDEGAEIHHSGQPKEDFQEILRGGQEIEEGAGEQEIDYIVDQ